MTHAQSHEDGNLPAARQRLGNAISALIDPKPETRQHDTDGTKIEWLDSLYDQLCDAVPGGQGNGSSPPKSSPPMCIDAIDLLTSIRVKTSEWEPRPNIDASGDPGPIEIIRLKALDARLWRPQDCTHIATIATTIQGWCASIRELLTPERHWTLPNPCPACQTAIVYRKNSAGESVRQPALQIGPNGCTCQNCRYTWDPQHFAHLARVLGTMPDGVLE